MPVARIDLAQIASLTFQKPDEERFPALRLAREVMAARGLSGAAFNAAKEIALDHFIAGNIGFLDMAAVVEDALASVSGCETFGKLPQTLEDVLSMDHLARKAADTAAGLRQQKR